MDAGEVPVFEFDAELGGYGRPRFRMQKTHPTLFQAVQSAVEHTGGWLVVELQNKDTFSDGPKWIPAQINVAHFAMLTEVKS
jgi:hypothetical protein